MEGEEMEEIKHKVGSMLRVKVEYIKLNEKKSSSIAYRVYDLYCENRNGQYIELEEWVHIYEKPKYEVGDWINVKIYDYHFDDDWRIDFINWEEFYGWEVLKLMKEFAHELKKKRNNRYLEYKTNIKGVWEEGFYEEFFEIKGYKVGLTSEVNEVDEYIQVPGSVVLYVTIEKDDTVLDFNTDGDFLAIYSKSEMEEELNKRVERSAQKYYNVRYHKYHLKEKDVQKALGMVRECLGK